MRRIFPILMMFIACKPAGNNPAEKEKPSQVRQVSNFVDPHSFSKPGDVVVTHLDLDLHVDFDDRQLSGIATWTIHNKTGAGEVILDADGLAVQSIYLDDSSRAEFSLDSAKTFLGSALRVKIKPGTKKFSIVYHTTSGAKALQWLAPGQTAGKKHPFLFTQSQPTLARTWVPCQDGPAIRFTYNATVTVPKGLVAVMSAEGQQQESPDGRYQFSQTHPVPAYLLALAAGDIAFKAIDKRTGVYAEPSVVDKAAWEFADMGKMMEAAEKIYGAYRWGRYDVIVLPPGFPYGGMENPNLTFVTPSLLAGDRSLVNVIAHELAHSWSGNLVTNATWNDMWLNEGFTTYFERRIVESLYGAGEKQMQEVLGRKTLLDLIKEKGDTSPDTRLKADFTGRDPGEASSEIVYEKGYAFLRVIEEAAGRENFDSFLNNYFDKHAFASLTSEAFLADLKNDLIKGDEVLAGKIRAEEWIYKPGLPSNIIPVSAPGFRHIDELIGTLVKTNRFQGDTALASTNEKLYFIDNFPVDSNARNVTLDRMRMADSLFHFTTSGNAEVSCKWLTLAVQQLYTPAYKKVEEFLRSIGRKKLILPVYKAMVQTPAGKLWAEKVFSKAKSGYHPVSYDAIEKLVND